MMPIVRLAKTDRRRAPTRPPTALAAPNVSNTRRSTSARSSHSRSAVAVACGMATSRTAVLVPNSIASSGVIRLPIPNPATAATPPGEDRHEEENDQQHGH